MILGSSGTARGFGSVVDQNVEEPAQAGAVVTGDFDRGLGRLAQLRAVPDGFVVECGPPLQMHVVSTAESEYNRQWLIEREEREARVRVLIRVVDQG
ncbi:MAG TPA: hypothetical protein VIR58_08030 [Acidimicrobiales bacterium]